ncbi:hypothetical protein VTL71DRAFT_7604 [Oculimacula yallundae]|uniref:Uncharacterized protein n=1 Tax=Oculimacula yallundae TaxID=86028 RepID=A0ABR4BUN9_9HELO
MFRARQTLTADRLPLQLDASNQNISDLRCQIKQRTSSPPSPQDFLRRSTDDNCNKPSKKRTDSTAPKINTAENLPAAEIELTHYAFDAVLISAFLAGMRRSTGLTPSFKKESISENPDVNHYIGKYLGIGEWVMDQSVAIAGSSGWFERKR